MPVKVVMQNELSMGAADRVREMAEVVVDPELEQVSGADIVVAGRGPIDAEFMSRAGNRLKMVATPGIGVDKIDVEAAPDTPSPDRRWWWPHWRSSNFWNKSPIRQKA